MCPNPPKTPGPIRWVYSIYPLAWDHAYCSAYNMYIIRYTIRYIIRYIIS